MHNSAARNDAAEYKVAYDLARFDPRRRVREAVLEAPAAQRVRSREKADALTRVYMRLSPMTVASFLAAAALLIMIVFGAMQVSIANLANGKLTSELSELKKEEKQILKKLENSINLGEVEMYAVQELGMVGYSEENIRYVDLSGEDHGVIYAQDGFWDIIENAFSEAWEKLADFFR